MPILQGFTVQLSGHSSEVFRLPPYYTEAEGFLGKQADSSYNALPCT